MAVTTLQDQSVVAEPQAAVIKPARRVNEDIVNEQPKPMQCMTAVPGGRGGPIMKLRGGEKKKKKKLVSGDGGGDCCGCGGGFGGDGGDGGGGGFGGDGGGGGGGGGC